MLISSQDMAAAKEIPQPRGIISGITRLSDDFTRVLVDRFFPPPPSWSLDSAGEDLGLFDDAKEIRKIIIEALDYTGTLVTASSEQVTPENSEVITGFVTPDKFFGILRGSVRKDYDNFYPSLYLDHSKPVSMESISFCLVGDFFRQFRVRHRYIFPDNLYNNPPFIEETHQGGESKIIPIDKISDASNVIDAILSALPISSRYLNPHNKESRDILTDFLNTYTEMSKPEEAVDLLEPIGLCQ